jgi:phosphoesterase RecJ-like protein
VSEFSRRHFSGGGHHNAAGGISYEPLDQTVGRFLELLPEYQSQLVAGPLAAAPPAA